MTTKMFSFYIQSAISLPLPSSAWTLSTGLKSASLCLCGFHGTVGH